jgi:hypothetical protein
MAGRREEALATKPYKNRASALKKLDVPTSIQPIAPISIYSQVHPSLKHFITLDGHVDGKHPREHEATDF